MIGGETEALEVRGNGYREEDCGDSCDSDSETPNCTNNLHE